MPAPPACQGPSCRAGTPAVPSGPPHAGSHTEGQLPTPAPQGSIFHKMEPAGRRCAAGRTPDGERLSVRPATPTHSGLSVRLSPRRCPESAVEWPVCLSICPSPRRCLESAAEQPVCLSICLPGGAQTGTESGCLDSSPFAVQADRRPAAGPRSCVCLCLSVRAHTHVPSGPKHTNELPPGGPDSPESRDAISRRASNRHRL